MTQPFATFTPGSPAAQGFRMPAEWAPHAATWLAWPHKADSWPGNFAPIPGLWVEMVRALVPDEHVHINVNDEAMADDVWRRLDAAGVPRAHVSVHRIPTNDAWARDHGPIFVTRDTAGGRDLLALDWIYNAWGGKYPPWDADDAVPPQVASVLGVPCVAPGIVLEGGSIDVNGARHAAHHRKLPAQSEPQSAPDAGADRTVSARLPRRGARSVAWRRHRR